MLAPNVARLFAYKTVWRGFGLQSAARALVRALGSHDPNVRTIAGMFLVQGGRDAKEPLLDALRRHEHPEMVLPILADIGDRSSRIEVQPFLEDPDPDIRTAAIEALRVLGYRVDDGPRGDSRGFGDMSGSG